MKNNFRYIGYLLMCIILSSACISCSPDSITPDEEVVESIINVSYTSWNASREQVQSEIKGCKLVGSGSDYLEYEDKNGTVKFLYQFVDDSLQASVAIAPKFNQDVFSSYLTGYESLGELSSKKVYYNTEKNNMCFSYDVVSGDTEYSVLGFTPIKSYLFKGDVIIKVDYKNLTYSVDGKTFKMILVDGGTLPSFYMMQTEVPLQGEFKVAGKTISKIDSNGDNCIIKAELRNFVNAFNDATGLDFRLPTEEEWKFAAKGGSKSQNYTYSGSNNINDVAWYSDNSNNIIHGIALKQPNELGLYDMSGNYAEVCSSDPLYIDGRTYGGNWTNSASQCTVTSYVSGNTSNSQKIPGTSIRELNAVDGRYISVRLVYSTPE